MKNLRKTVCRFCEKDLSDYKILPPDCDCDDYSVAKDIFLKELNNQVREELTPETDYPVTYTGDRLVVEEDGAHKLRLTARKYGAREGLVVSIPIPNPSGGPDAELGLDITDRDVPALVSLLNEYLEKVALDKLLAEKEQK